MKAILHLSIYFWLHSVFISVLEVSVVAVSGGYSCTAVHELLIALASLVVEHRL